MQKPPNQLPPALGAVSELAMLVAELDPSAAHRLQADHTADLSRRCRICRSVWPCTLYAIGRDASTHARQRRIPGR